MRIVCIIPSTLRKNSLTKCLNSIDKAKTKGISLSKVIVTTNNKLNLRGKFRYDDLYIVNQNFGFSEMINDALKESFKRYKPDYFLIINDDAWLEEDFFNQFKKVNNKVKYDLFSPLIRRPNGKDIDSFGDEYFTSGYAKSSRNVKNSTKLITAACVLIKSAFIKKVEKKYGFIFNPILYFYLEDVEFCIRALAIGGKIGKFENLVAFHLGFNTAGRKSFFKYYHVYRNVFWVIILTWPLASIIKKLLDIFVIHIFATIYLTLIFGPKLPIKAFLSTLYNMSRLIKYRKKILFRYSKKFNFDSIFSEYAFRTNGGKVFKF